MTNALIVYGLMAVIGLVAPITMAIIWKIKSKQPFLPILVGALIFFLFATILENIPKAILLNTATPIGSVIMSNVWLFSAVAALLAGIFEEVGRVVGYKLFLKRGMSRRTAISFGIGHGGFEIMYLMIIGGAQYFIYAMMVQSGQFDTIINQVAATAPEQVEAMAAIPEALAATSIATLFLSIFERVTGMLIHISCSIIVFKAVREKGKAWLVLVAILLHAVVDIFAALYQTGIITSVYVLEACMFVFALILFTLVFRLVYKKMPVSYADSNLESGVVNE